MKAISFYSSIPNVALDAANSNLFAESSFGGSSDGWILAGSGFNDSQHNVLVDSTLQNAGTAIRVTSSEQNLIADNTVLGMGAFGIHLATGVPATVRDNDISERVTGIYTDSKIANLHGNLVHDNEVGARSYQGVICFVGCGWISADATLPNQFYNNQIGIDIPIDAAGVLVGLTDIYNNGVGIHTLGDNTRLISNQIFGNTVGIEGSGLIGPADWQSDLFNFIHNNDIGVLTLSGAEVRFNKIYENNVGVEVASQASVHNNLIYRNVQQGILVSGATDAAIFNNTVVTPGGDAARISGFVSEVELVNNILWTQTGTALSVDAEAEFGLISDYNNLFAASGSGNVAERGKLVSDLYDWRVETDFDVNSKGSTSLAPLRDDPLFVDMASDDYHLQSGSTSIDAGRPGDDFSLEPAANGDRVNLGAYGNTLEAVGSTASWLSITYPEFYENLDHDELHEIRWDSYNLVGVDIQLRLIQEGTGTVTTVATVPVAAGLATWRPSDVGISGSITNRYRLELRTTSGTLLVESSREPFAIVDFDPAAANTFYVDDGDDTNDQYTPSAIGDNRNTGLTANDPKAMVRPLFLSYSGGPGDIVNVDTGSYVFMHNLTLRRTPLVFDPRMETVTDLLVTGPTDLALPRPDIDRANPYPGAAAMDIRDAANMSLYNLDIAGANIGVRARDGSTNFAGSQLTLRDHGADGLSVESGSDAASLENAEVFQNGRHGIFVDSQLDFIKNSQVHDNVEIGVALRNVGAALVQSNDVYANGIRGLDILNPGPNTALVGDAFIDTATFNDEGNLVHENGEEGIFAAGNVLVRANTVWENNQYGIRLADGADARENVVYTHERGISAKGSTSDIIANRSFNNSITGIEASYFSQVLENETYSNDLHGIDADRFGGLIEHNTVFETGYASVHIGGAGRGAEFINNTVYELCSVNDTAPHVGPTPVSFDWDWELTMDPPDFPPPPQPPFPVGLWGEAEFLFQEAVGLMSGDTLNLGAGGSSDALTPLPLPMGEMFEVNWDVQSFFSSTLPMGPPVPGYGDMFARLSTEQPSAGTMLVENIGGTLSGTVDLALFVEFFFSDSPSRLVPELPLIVSWTFGPTEGFHEFQLLQIPGEVPLSPDRFPGQFLDINNPSAPPWDVTLDFADAKPIEDATPQDRGDSCAEIAVLVDNESRNVYFRNNIIFAEGDATGGLPYQSVDIVVTADSTEGWDSDFNIITTIHGQIGEWAGSPAPSLVNWQTLSADDAFSDDPNPGSIWVDPDGVDNVLGSFAGQDNNFHQRSDFGHFISGGSSPKLLLPSGLPDFESPVMMSSAVPLVSNLSPGVDFGDPSFDFLLEVPEQGQMINVGAFGNTPQSAVSPTEYNYVVYPLGLEELVRGNTYEIQWRHDVFGTDVTIELLRNGALETVITPLTINNGSLLWTVPPQLPDDTTYEIQIKRAPVILLAETEIIDTSRRQFEISGSDTRPPAVLRTTPDILDTTLPATVLPTKQQLPTNQIPTDFNFLFSENLASLGTTELRSAGPAGSTTFGDGDDVLYSLTQTYTAGTHDGATSSLFLDLAGVVLPEGLYRLTISSSMSDAAGNALDGNQDGLGGDDWVQFFEIDTTGPTVSIPAIVPDPTNMVFDTLDIVFSAAVQDFGLDNLILSLDDPNGPNLLSGDQRLTTSDNVTWTLENLTDTTDQEGNYYLTLTATGSAIVDLAGNSLLNDASEDWELDLTPPKLVPEAIEPDPRNTAITVLNLQESEPVFDFRLADLILTRDGVPITGSLVDITGVEGIYHLTMVDQPALRDAAGNTIQELPHEVWQVFTTAPEAVIVPVLPDPRNQLLDQIEINFIRQVTGLDLGDFTLTRGGSANLLTGSESLLTIDNLHYTLTGLAPLTGVAGNYTLTLSAAASGIADLAGNALQADALEQWVMDIDLPTLLDIVDVTPDPRNTAVSSISFTFSKAVLGFDLSDLELTRDDGTVSPNLLTAAQTLTTSDNVSWTLSGLSSLTALAGSYEFVLDAATAGIVDAAGNALLVGGSEAWLTDLTAPTMTIMEVTPDPRTQSVAEMQLVFTEEVTGLDRFDLTLRRNGGPNLLTMAQTLTTSDDVTFTLENLSGLTSLPGEYELSLRTFNSQVQDLAGNLLAAGDFDVFLLVADPDLNADGDLDCDDVDALVAGLAASSTNPIYDMNGDGQVDLLDLDAWLATAGAMNLPSGNAYLLGDADLDGVVDVSDFNSWNTNKFTFNAGWCGGDFNADGVVDVSDFNIWNNNKFQTALALTPAGQAWADVDAAHRLRESDRGPSTRRLAQCPGDSSDDVAKQGSRSCRIFQRVDAVDAISL